MKYFLTPLLLAGALAACSAPANSNSSQIAPVGDKVASESSLPSLQPFVPDVADGLSVAIVAGGCFWCVESDFEKLDGVSEVVSGYSGGELDNPTYKEVSYTETGHYEVAKIIFDPKVISYRELIDHYWTTVDPTDAGGQFCDRGSSYRTAIFATPEQRDAAEASRQAVLNSGQVDDIVTPILPAVTFYDAEDYHQDYYKKNPIRYKYYRTGCGRDARLKELWSK